MTENAEKGNAAPGDATDNLRARVARLNSEVEAAEARAAVLTDTLNEVRTAVKQMGWRKRDCDEEALRSLHNANITEILAILDGNKAVADAYREREKSK